MGLIKGFEVYKSIVAVTAALASEGISKDKTNQQQGFKYRGIDQVYAALSVLLAKNNLCIMPRITSKEVVERTNAKGTTLFYTTVEAQFDIVSAVDGSCHTVTTYGEAMDSGDKSIGKAMSYAYKAMAFMLFAIPVEGQEDSDANSHEVKPSVVSEREYLHLLALISEVNADERRFCTYYKINDVAELPVAKYDAAVKGLEMKRGK